MHVPRSTIFTGGFQTAYGSLKSLQWKASESQNFSAISCLASMGKLRRITRQLVNTKHCEEKTGEKHNLVR